MKGLIGFLAGKMYLINFQACYLSRFKRRRPADSR